jgi:hypothetical protein
MKKIVYSVALLAVVMLAACSKNFEDMNTNPKQPTDVPSAYLLTSAQKNLTDILASSNVNRNVFRLWTQHWTETTYFDESRYDVVTRLIAANFWTPLYRDVLKDLDACKTAIAADPKITDKSIKASQTAVADILEVYTYSVLLETYGNVPYSEAMDITNLQPKYDDAMTTYKDLFKRLDADITNLKAGSSSFAAGDVIYGGDNMLWVKFAATLKMRMAMTLSEATGFDAKTAFEGAVADAMSSNADDAIFHYESTPPNTNPIWVDLIQSGRKDFIASETIITWMQDSLSDPRLSAYFRVNSAGNYTGGINGTGNSYKNNSKPSYAVTDAAAPATLMNYTETEFLLAEAAARGWAVSGTAEDHYKAGINASFVDWGVTVDSTSFATYYNNRNVQYNSASYKQCIGLQKWLALYNRPVDAWTEWRRLDYPALTPPPGMTAADIPTRMTYPINEQTINGSSYNAASTAIGGDKLTTKLFWDKH